MSKVNTKTTTNKAGDTNKAKYKVTNWREYTKSLIKRVSLEVWIDEDGLNNWHYDCPAQRGAQFQYSDEYTN